ncbi:MAG: pyridoxal-dependent decarboxylase [Gammaproteobacteria bacterium]|nr:pyridoxal-dependent decarboxylase [Gammaproteobacteria bacterium]
MKDGFINSLFLGPYGENNDIFEKMLLEFLRDHVYWRRNFHPEDPPAIPTLAANDPEYTAMIARMSAELHRLSAALKRSVPFSSPRYIGHMASDTLLPALIAQMMTLPYNPNNVVDEAAPVTLDMEISAGLQIARMLGFNTNESEADCAFGHITSGGTVANYEALHMQRALRCWPLALKRALASSGHELVHGKQDLAGHDSWTLANLSTDDILVLADDFQAMLQSLPTDEARSLLKAVKLERVEHLGWHEFASRHPDWQPPVLLLPVTAHYSWAKAMKLLGLGEAQLRVIPETGMRMDMAALETTLADCAARRQPVIGLVGVLGTTEYGTVDPIADMLAIRNQMAERGIYAPVHVDGAWGGYLTSLFRNPDGGLVPHEEVRQQFKYFPSETVHAAFGALARTESVTIDPHKLGFVPFGAGAIVYRDQRMMPFVAHDADYVFDPERQDDSYRARFRALGKYILEGSKSGAAAAGVFVSQSVLPLDRDNLGRIIERTLHATEAFYDAALALARELENDICLLLPIEPDSNLACLAFNVRGNTSLREMNRFTRRIIDQVRIDPGQPVQVREFFGSYTTLTREGLGATHFATLLERLGIESADDQDRIYILRHTLMNPWLLQDIDGQTHIDHYFSFLGRLLRGSPAGDAAP